MREYWILTKLQFTSLFGINKIRHTKSEEDKKKGKKALTTLLVMTFALLYMSVIYSGLLASAFSAFGMLPAMLGIMAMAASLLILVFATFEVKGMIFGFGDYDILMSWPVDVRAVACSRVTNLYISNLVYALLLLLPAGGFYAAYAHPVWWYYPLFLFLTLLVPALPCVLGAILGTLLAAATSRMKKKNIFSTIGQLLLILGVMFLSFRTSAGLENIGEKAGMLQEVVGKSYPPAMWFQTALSEGKLLPALWLLLCALALFALLIWLLDRCFVRVNSFLRSAPTRGKRFVLGRQTRVSATRALFGKEIRRYFASSIYVTNTAFGYVMLLAAAVAALIKGKELLSLDASLTKLLYAVVPFALSWIVGMSTTTGSAISMEGKSLWIVKSMPILARDWLKAKLYVSLSLAVPCTLVFCSLVAVGLRASALDALYIVLIPLAYAFFFAVFGLWVNIRFPRLDWTSEAEVVKQGVSTMLVVFGSMLFAAAPAVLAAMLNNALVAPLAALVVAAVTALLWINLCKSAERRLYRL